MAERRPAPGSPVYDDDDEDTVTTYRYRRSYYPYGYGSPYYYGPPGYVPPGAIPPDRPPPRVYARPAQPNNGDNCHFHAYPGEGPYHREIRCHWHANPYHPSIRYIR
ncbi:hypothetical protein [Prosthecodimorpha staleyi]|uniref:Uncharacterized protein n=1 Tax=Prosthecodimorpha staleyi TaxID=2840188 RepID=A0A947D5A8_9HYPH|nr:hypothetical protein [Prosthecodimorpha staleyi]MBT9288447.1 hypothetical protein [Prosthecodimorpha staleyi]